VSSVIFRSVKVPESSLSIPPVRLALLRARDVTVALCEHDGVSQPAPQQPDGQPQHEFPAPGRYGEYSGSAAAGPPQPTGPGLGWIALVAGVIALIGSVLNAVIVIALLSPDRLDAGSDGGSIAATFGFALASGLLIWFGFGLWAIIQGAIAAARRRGQVQGIIAILIGLIGPWVGVVLAIGALSEAWASV
jgi:hypothetical protein